MPLHVNCLFETSVFAQHCVAQARLQVWRPQGPNHCTDACRHLADALLHDPHVRRLPHVALGVEFAVWHCEELAPGSLSPSGVFVALGPSLIDCRMLLSQLQVES